MAIKAGKVLTVGNGMLVSRLEQTGATSLNIPTERVRETGNEEAVAVTRDIPDLQFGLESFDATIDTEAGLCNIDPTTLSDGDVIDFSMAKPYDVTSPYKDAGASKAINAGVIFPSLYLESATYRFGIESKATQSFSLRGDSMYGAEKVPYRETFAGRGAARVVTDGVTTNSDATITSATAAFTATDVGATVTGTGIPGSTTILSVTSATEVELSANATATDTGVELTITPLATYAFANTAIKTVEKGEDLYAVGACVYKSTGTWERLFLDTDFANTSAGITLNATGISKVGVGDTLALCYFSAEPISYAQTVHPDPTVKPAAVRGEDIDLYVAASERRVLADGVTNTDTSLVSATAAFTSADVGARLEGSGIADGTLIDSVTNSTTVVLSDATTATATDVTFTLWPPLSRWDGVQSVEVNWRVQLDQNKELGNPHNVDMDYDIPEVSGSITTRPYDNEALFDKIAQITGADTDEVTNILGNTALEMRIVLRVPDTSTTLKTFRVEGARIQPPSNQARAGSKIEPQFQWEDDSGLLQIIKGAFVAD